ncbi:hypothetical protein [Clostridium thailandense]|uniref:hypothetical protein n=1 Tax=Clostridium thailandense TaxID=2794346 RepID=UPI00398A2B4C
MLKLTWIELFLRLIPENLILVWGIHVIAKKSYSSILNYIFASIAISTIAFFIRWLPIYFGVHMVINIILTISIMVIIGIPIIKTIYSTLLMYFILSFSEFINMIMLNLFNIDVNFKFSEPLMKCVLGIPSLITASVFIIVIKYFLKMKARRKNYYAN